MSGRIERLETHQETMTRLRSQPDGLTRIDRPRGWEMVAGDLTWSVTMVPGMFSSGAGHLAALAPRQHVVIDRGAWRHHEEAIRGYYARHEIDVAYTTLPGGDAEKTLSAVGKLVDGLADRAIGRSDVLVGIGGGAVLDMVSLTGSLYRRGIGVARVPTTLLSVVDASVGVKTGVNHSGKKNLIGDYSSGMTLIDTDLMVTVEPRQMRSGLAECLKMGIAVDPLLTSAIDRHGNALLRRQPTPGSVEIITRSIDAMVTELQRNPREWNKRRPADFGHAFGPLLEMDAGILHGESVAADMATMLTLAMSRGRMSRQRRDELLSLMRRLGLMTWHGEITPDLLDRALAEVTRHRGGRQNIPLPSGNGRVDFVNDVTPRELWAAAQETRDWQPQGGTA